MSETKQVELQSKDKQSFKVDRDVILMSGLVKDMLEEGDEDDCPIIPVPNVDSKPLQKVIEYCQYHHKEPAQEIEKPLKGKIEDVICDWDKKVCVFIVFI